MDATKFPGPIQQAQCFVTQILTALEGMPQQSKQIIQLCFQHPGVPDTKLACILLKSHILRSAGGREMPRSSGLQRLK